MKGTIVSILLLLTFAAAVLAQTTAQPNETRETFSVQVDVKDTPQQQLAYARSLALVAYQAHDAHERLNATAQAAAALEIISRRWPDNRDATIDAALAAADLYLATSSPSDAEKALLAVEPLVKGQKREASVYLGLGRAEMRLHNVKDAETRLLAAERLANRDSAEVEFGATRELASFYERRGNAQEARKRYRALVRHPLSPPEISARFLVHSMELGVMDGNIGEMKKDMSEFDAMISNVPPGASRERLKGDADKLRKKYKL